MYNSKFNINKNFYIVSNCVLMHMNCSIKTVIFPHFSRNSGMILLQPPCIRSSFQPDHALSQRQNRYHISQRAIVDHIANGYFSHVQKCVCAYMSLFLLFLYLSSVLHFSLPNANPCKTLQSLILTDAKTIDKIKQFL